MDEEATEISSKELFAKVSTISIDLGQEASLTLESSPFGGTYWMLGFPNGRGSQVDNEIATALIAAVNGAKTKLSHDDYYMTEEEMEEIRQAGMAAQKGQE